jgi:hypothetical protein
MMQFSKYAIIAFLRTKLKGNSPNKQGLSLKTRVKIYKPLGTV